jgi:hypothetical protein
MMVWTYPIYVAVRSRASMMVWTYLVYVAVSLAATIWVGRSLHRNGRVFLVENFHGQEKLADSVNHLLLVGFYLINIGFISLALRYGAKPTEVVGAVLVRFRESRLFGRLAPEVKIA